jgi:hypothetical protein
MKNTKEKISLDDVLDYYLTSTEETGKDVLEEVVRLYPQYELELRELAANQKIFGRISPREYTDEEEQSLTIRAVSVVQSLLYQQRQEKASDTITEEAFTGLRDEIEKRYASAEEFYEKTWLSEGIIWTLDDRQVRFKSIPQKAIENIANALGRFVSTISKCLQGEMLVAPSHYKAEQAPEVSGRCDFSDLVRMDPDLSEERKEFWLSQLPVHEGDKQE